MGERRTCGPKLRVKCRIAVGGSPRSVVRSVRDQPSFRVRVRAQRASRSRRDARRGGLVPGGDEDDALCERTQRRARQSMARGNAPEAFAASRSWRISSAVRWCKSSTAAYWRLGGGRTASVASERARKAGWATGLARRAVRCAALNSISTGVCGGVEVASEAPRRRPANRRNAPRPNGQYTHFLILCP